MRFLDIGVAIMIGVSTVPMLVVLNPRSGDDASDRLAAQGQLRDQILAFAEQRGIPWLLRAQVGDVCSALSSAIDGTSSVFVAVGSGSCGDQPPPYAFVSNLTFWVALSRVELVAWSSA